MASEGTKDVAAAQEVVAEDYGQLHIGEWVQLVPQECEETLARKLQHVSHEKGHRRQQQPIGEWLQHLPGGWVLSSSRYDPRLPFPHDESPDFWIPPPSQQSVSKEVCSSPFENDKNHLSWQNRAPHGAKRWSLETSQDGGRLAESYEDWKVKFSSCLKQSTLPKASRRLSIHKHDNSIPVMRQSPPSLCDSNYNLPPGPHLHQLVKPPDDAYENNGNSNINGNTQQHNTLFDTNSNINHNSMFYLPNTFRNDCIKRWSLPHPLLAEERLTGRSQTHQQKSATKEELLQRPQQSTQFPSSFLLRNEEHLSDMATMDESEEDQTRRKPPCALRGLMFSEETIL